MFDIRNITARRRILLAWMPEGSKGADLRSAGHLSAWVRTPLQASYFFYSTKKKLFSPEQVKCFNMPPWPNG